MASQVRNRRQWPLLNRKAAPSSLQGGVVQVRRSQVGGPAFGGRSVHCGTGRHNIDWLQLLAPYLLFPSQPNSEEGSMLCKATTVLFSPRRVPPRIVAPAPDLRTQPAQDWTWPPSSHTSSRPDDADIHSRPRHPKDASLVSRRMSFCQPWSHPGTKSLSGSRHPSGSSVDNPHRHLSSSLNPYHLTIPGLLVVYTGTCTARFHLAGEALLGSFKDTGR